MSESTRARTLGRYALFDEIASGGMASVHVGRLIEPLGFSRTVAIKRLHAQFAKDEMFVAMFLDEARLAARIRHPNVVPTLDIVTTDGELFLVMEYVLGEPLSRLALKARARKEHVPQRIVLSIMIGALNGLHAAHEATSDRGEPLHIVHRDVSPHNILVGVDGVARLLDFGVAKAAGRIHTTKDGKIKGKLAYMAPEQLHNQAMDRRTDVYAASVVLWETLVGQRLFIGESEGATITKVLSTPVDLPSTLRPDLDEKLDAVVMRGLDRSPKKRFSSAREMALALEAAVGSAGLASTNEIGEWVESIAADDLGAKAKLIAEIEGTSSAGANAPIPAMAEAAAKSGVQPREIVGEVSSLSISREQVARPRRRWFSGVWIAAAVVAIAAFATWRIRSEPAAQVQHPEPQATTPTQPTVQPSFVAVAPLTGTVPRESAPIASASSKRIAPVKSKPSATASAANNCDPNYTYVNGIKQYKPWCFGAQ